jgi:ankyrin repeat protein
MVDFSGRSTSRTYVLAAAISCGNEEINSVLEHWASPYDASKLVLAVKAAIQSKETWLVGRLLGIRPKNQEPKRREGTAIAMAAWFKREELLFLLLEHLPPAQWGFLPERLWPNWERGHHKMQATLMAPVRLGDQGMLETFLAKGFRGDRETLAVAVEKNDLTIATALLASGCALPRKGRPPLPLAVENGNMSMIQLLLQHGEDINEEPRLRLGRSALQQAVECGNLEVIQFLLDAGADVNTPPAKSGGATALQLAAIKGFLGIAKLLLDRTPPADINAAGARKNGRTALEGAAEHGRIDMVQFLLSSGAETSGPGKKQYLRAIRLAREKGHDVAATILEEHRELTRNKPRKIQLEGDNSESESLSSGSSAVEEDTDDTWDDSDGSCLASGSSEAEEDTEDAWDDDFMKDMY